jgi:hypothetical protein
MTWPAAACECPLQGSQSDRITDGSWPSAAGSACTGVDPKRPVASPGSGRSEPIKLPSLPLKKMQ